MKIKDIYSDLPILETERLILRKITLDDLEEMFHYCSNDEVTKYLVWDTHKTIEDTKAFIDFSLKRYKAHQLSPWGIVDKENKKFIGTIDFITWDTKHKTAEIGYALSHEHWGKGMMTEAAKQVISFGFEHMDLTRIQARCFVENFGSERVMQKSGMTFEGILRKSMFVKGEHKDLKIYSILKEEHEQN
ncbi:GNAT family protein [Lysinibacillus halotolerans]|uniref:N-acetyltransferase n=1 Tax=Lysinibacillus halotolerans TaxID=1368476 RepID=A0A3M8GYU4_9BACI|nr:GNAT family protein [Lysinibacillus halotolerans]RNC95412.1 N-acetyltransferase [Lysinibacillus halotolerans]